MEPRSGGPVRFLPLFLPHLAVAVSAEDFSTGGGLKGYGRLDAARGADRVVALARRPGTTGSAAAASSSSSVTVARGPATTTGAAASAGELASPMEGAGSALTRAPAATAAAPWPSLLGRLVLACLSALATALRIRGEATFGVALLVLRRMDELLPAVFTDDELVVELHMSPSCARSRLEPTGRAPAALPDPNRSLTAGR
jgi:hypothetical protein